MSDGGSHRRCTHKKWDGVELWRWMEWYGMVWCGVQHWCSFLDELGVDGGGGGGEFAFWISGTQPYWTILEPNDAALCRNAQCLFYSLHSIQNASRLYLSCRRFYLPNTFELFLVFPFSSVFFVCVSFHPPNECLSIFRFLTLHIFFSLSPFHRCQFISSLLSSRCFILVEFLFFSLYRFIRTLFHWRAYAPESNRVRLWWRCYIRLMYKTEFMMTSLL